MKSTYRRSKNLIVNRIAAYILLLLCILSSTSCSLFKPRVEKFDVQKGGFTIYAYNTMNDIPYKRTIYGTAVSGKTRKKVENAEVTAYDAAENIILTCRTDKKGKFKFLVDKNFEFGFIEIEDGSNFIVVPSNFLRSKFRNIEIKASLFKIEDFEHNNFDYETTLEVIKELKELKAKEKLEKKMKKRK